MNKKISLGLALSLAVLAAALSFVLTMSFSQKLFSRKIGDVDKLADKVPALEEVDQTIRKYFYTDIDEEKMQDGLLGGYVSGLGDQYSGYMSAAAYSENQNDSQGVYTGIGISVMQNADGNMEIQSVVKGGPAEEAGLAVGDCIIEVESIKLAEDYEKAYQQILGEAGTFVKLKVRKADSQQEKELSVERRLVDEETVTSKMLEHHLGYIRISKFRTVTVEQFETAMSELRQQGAEGFIFDVRNNGGGLLSALEQMIDPILPAGDIAFADYKDGHEDVIIKSDENELKMPYAVLMNGYSASAAELFACSLRDYANAILVGEKSFGKGIMQTTFPLSAGGAVTLTVATYKTGITPCYHGVGLEPDVPAAYDEKAETDTQLEAAENALLEQIQKAA